MLDNSSSIWSSNQCLSSFSSSVISVWHRGMRNTEEHLELPSALSILCHDQMGSFTFGQKKDNHAVIMGAIPAFTFWSLNGTAVPETSFQNSPNRVHMCSAALFLLGRHSSSPSSGSGNRRWGGGGFLSAGGFFFCVSRER